MLVRQLCGRRPHFSHSLSGLRLSLRPPNYVRAGWTSQICATLDRHRAHTRLSSTTAVTAQKTWVDRLPAPIRPYLYLTRVDKPIGTLLLFYPCGMYYICTSFPSLKREASCSMVDYDGLLRDRGTIHRPPHMYQSLWARGSDNERRRMYHKRHVGQKLGQGGW